MTLGSKLIGHPLYLKH